MIFGSPGSAKCVENAIFKCFWVAFGAPLGGSRGPLGASVANQKWVWILNRFRGPPEILRPLRVGGKKWVLGAILQTARLQDPSTRIQYTGCKDTEDTGYKDT